MPQGSSLPQLVPALSSSARWTLGPSSSTPEDLEQEGAAQSPSSQQLQSSRDPISQCSFLLSQSAGMPRRSHLDVNEFVLAPFIRASEMRKEGKEEIEELGEVTEEKPPTTKESAGDGETLEPMRASLVS